MGNLDELIAGVGNAAHTRLTFGAGGTSGNTGAVTLFNVTGLVAVKIYCVGEVALTGASATIEVGVTGTTAGLVAQTTATALIANEIWHDATPDALLELSSVSTEKIISSNIILTIATAAVTGGRVRFTVLWRPVTKDSYLEPVVFTSASPSLSPSASLSPSSSLSPSASLSPSSSISPSASSSLSLSPSSSLSPSASRSPSASVSLSLSPSASISL